MTGSYKARLAIQVVTCKCTCNTIIIIIKKNCRFPFCRLLYAVFYEYLIFPVKINSPIEIIFFDKNRWRVAYLIEVLFLFWSKLYQEKFDCTYITSKNLRFYKNRLLLGTSTVNLLPNFLSHIVFYLFLEKLYHNHSPDLSDVPQPR
jgi:hypothetical protein